MYSEYKTVEKPIIKALQKLGWDYIKPEQNKELRNNATDFFIFPHLKKAILKLNENKGITEEHADAIINKLKRLNDNEEFYYWLKGERSFKPASDKKNVTISLIDFKTIANNDFTVTNQYTCPVTDHSTTNDKNIRPDIMLLVNGIPISLIECKVLSTDGSNVREGHKQLTRYQEVCPDLFFPNVFNISTDGFKLKYGSTGSPYRYFAEWKDKTGFPEEILEDSAFKAYAEENKKEFNPFIDHQVWGLLNKKNFLDLIQNFVVFETREGTTVKKIARYQQFRAVNKIVDRVIKGEMKTGLIWHTQGSGKSLTMLFTAWKLRKLTELNNPTVLIITDRIDLDNQIADTFDAVKMPNTERASSTSDLRKKLIADKRQVIISTIFKFNDLKDVLVERDNIIILIDEAHRTQEGDNSAEMRRSLKNAYFFGFTGTPIDKEDTNTHRNFGMRPDKQIERYMDLYNIKEAIDDGATVPVHYQLRNRNWHLSDVDIDKVIEEEYSFLDEESTEVLKKKASSFTTFMMKPERLESIAQDIKEHFLTKIEPNGFKAQVVCYTREACFIIKEHLDRILGTQYSEIVYSKGQNDVPEVGSKIDLRKHHKTKEQIKQTVLDFKDKNHPLKIIIVQSMLLTGFDAPIEQVMYLDRPLKDHSLLQAVARTNRPYDNKKCGIIVDYCGVLKNLNKALNFNEEEITGCLIDYDKLKDEMVDFLEQFERLFTGIEKSNLSHCLKHIEDNKLDTEVRTLYRNISLIYETLSPDPFILDYSDRYKWTTQIIIAYRQLISQEKPDISDYLAHTRELIQSTINLDDINKVAPVFVVDDNYLKKLDGSKLDLDGRESTLEHRLRSMLRDKVGDLPIYKTLQERLQEIIENKNADTAQTVHLLEQLTLDTVDALKADEAMADTKGQRAISQILRNKIQNEEILKNLTSKIHEIVLNHTRDFKNWQEQGTKIAQIKKELIIFFATLNMPEFKLEPDEYSDFSNELLKYIESHY